MGPSTNEKVIHLLPGVAGLFFARADFAFWFGDGLVHTIIPGTNRILAEVEGVALAGLCLGLGAIARAAEDRLEAGELDPKGPKSLAEVFGKEDCHATLQARFREHLRPPVSQNLA